MVFFCSIETKFVKRSNEAGSAKGLNQFISPTIHGYNQEKILLEKGFFSPAYHVAFKKLKNHRILVVWNGIFIKLKNLRIGILLILS